MGHSSAQNLAPLQRGDTCYGRGHIPEAIELYRQAVQADPTDITPLLGLTAALYDIGDYVECVTEIDNAVGLAAEEDKALISKLQARKVRAHILEGDFERARKTLQDHSNMIEDVEATNLGSAIQVSLKAVALWPQSQRCSDNLALYKIVNDLPRFKPALKNVTEYFHVGHDDQGSLFNEPGASHPLAFLFAGIGDARNMHATLRHIAEVEKQSAERPTSQYHFTVIDIKAHAIARDLIIFMLLEELTKESTKTSLEEHEGVLATLFYVYGAVIMPPKAYERLRRTIIDTIALVEGTSGTLTWLLIFEKDRRSIKAALLSWLQDAEQQYSTSVIRRIAAEKSFRKYAKSINGGRYAGSEKGCYNDDIMFDKAAVLTPPESFFEDDLLNFKQILAGPNPSTAMDSSWLERLDRSWKPNVTLLDTEWLNSGHVESGFGFDPFLLYTLMLDSSPENPKCLYDYAASYFTALGEAILHLKTRIRVEVMVGEMTQLFDQIRYGLLEHRKNSKGLESLHTHVESNVPTWVYPQEYDRIHMSNIPDYTGGPLSCFLFAAPVTRISQGNWYFTSKCLLSADAFTSEDEFYNEYCLVPDRRNLYKVFPSKCTDSARPLTGYPHWFRAIQQVKFHDRWDQCSLSTWLHGIFLKIALPAQRESPTNKILISPLNLSIFFRLLHHLREVGYPAHWLSDILSSLLTNTLETRARPPRTAPLAVEETQQMFENKPQEMSIAPFITELTTLASIWLPAFNFGLLSGHAAIPPQTDVRKYSMAFEDVKNRKVYNWAHALVFADREIVFHSGVPMSNWPLRETLSDDESDRKKRLPLGTRAHTEGLHVVSTWTYRTEGREAAFWMRDDVMRGMLGKGSWWCSIWSFDSWEMVASPVNVIREEVRDLGAWV